MHADKVRETTYLILKRIISEKDQAIPQITDETALLGEEVPIDSLDLAVLVVELQEMTGKDPFKNGFVNFRTVGELIQLYAGRS